MHHFDYRAGVMHAEDVDLKALAEDVGTPLYCYSSATIERHYKVFDQAFDGLDHRIYYAVKANSNQAVIRMLGDLGAGFDVVSEGELRRVLTAGISARRVVFSGVGKTAREMALALREGIACFNVESEPELELLSSVATRTGTRTKVSLRVNPDVDAGTHEKITTGLAVNKFGIPFARARQIYARAAALPGLEVAGIDMHIGSQIATLEPFEKAYRLMAELLDELRQDGHDIRHLDLGGGLGVPYRDDEEDPPLPLAYAAMVKRVLGNTGCRIMLEPGRLIVANAGVMVTRVIHVKEAGERVFVIVDAAMNDLVRPTLYDAWHEVRAIDEEREHGARRLSDVVGPVCETGDYLAQGRMLAEVEAGDLLAVMTAGAYGAVQSSTYNTRPLIPEVLVRKGRFSIIRPRQSYDDLIGLDRLAGWQT